MRDRYHEELDAVDRVQPGRQQRHLDGGGAPSKRGTRRHEDGGCFNRDLIVIRS